MMKPEVVQEDDVLLTPEEAADFLRVNRETVYRNLRKGRLPGEKFGGQWRISKRALTIGSSYTNGR